LLDPVKRCIASRYSQALVTNAQCVTIILYDYSDLDSFFLPGNRVCRLSLCLPHANNAQQQTADRTDGQPFAQSARTEEFRGLPPDVSSPSSVFPSPPPAFQLASPSREKVRSRSITAARLSTHIFDCSANMPKFIPRPSSSASDCYVDGASPSRVCHDRALLVVQTRRRRRVCSLRALRPK
jgi:hypothetical protein